jgi:glycosyltransferase involved in cell wall biosynthesis
VITDRIDGFLITDGKDIDGMIEVLSNLKDSLRRNGIASAARKKAETLGWEQMAEKYSQILGC